MSMMVDCDALMMLVILLGRDGHHAGDEVVDTMGMAVDHADCHARGLDG